VVHSLCYSISNAAKDGLSETAKLLDQQIEQNKQLLVSHKLTGSHHQYMVHVPAYGDLPDAVSSRPGPAASAAATPVSKAQQTINDRLMSAARATVSSANRDRNRDAPVSSSQQKKMAGKSRVEGLHTLASIAHRVGQAAHSPIAPRATPIAVPSTSRPQSASSGLSLSEAKKQRMSPWLSSQHANDRTSSSGPPSAVVGDQVERQGRRAATDAIGFVDSRVPSPMQHSAPATSSSHRKRPDPMHELAHEFRAISVNQPISSKAPSSEIAKRLDFGAAMSDDITNALLSVVKSSKIEQDSSRRTTSVASSSSSHVREAKVAIDSDEDSNASCASDASSRSVNSSAFSKASIRSSTFLSEYDRRLAVDWRFISYESGMYAVLELTGIPSAGDSLPPTMKVLVRWAGVTSRTALTNITKEFNEKVAQKWGNWKRQRKAYDAIYTTDETANKYILEHLQVRVLIAFINRHNSEQSKTMSTLLPVPVRQQATVQVMSVTHTQKNERDIKGWLETMLESIELEPL
jgi:hypothetical protein